ncbi:MAG: ABC transporter permease [Candidatus Aminicenantes bacterium]|nr:ABC transporter permease [Candidatus Aminicenantes bacterium]MDH5384193.1 ABC transporter permease [Candidatus Aminicenantes bacterium]MDH5742956.1 ABC transporter permease [Candidatus Aminicenantes bacterium]
MAAKKGREPPALAKWLFSRLTIYEDEFLSAGDMEEEFEERVGSEGAVKARSWYWRQILKSIPAYIVYFIFGTLDMVKNYFKSAFRNMKRDKVYTLLNLAGLAVGMSCFIIIGLWVQHELSFDEFHARSDKIYRIGNAVTLKTGDERDMVYTSAAMGPTLVEDYPEIETATRMRGFHGANFKVGDKDFIENWGFYAEPSFFDVFSFPLLSGNPSDALEAPRSIILSQKVALKFFGDENPVGKTLLLNGEACQVTGLIKDPPSNSHLQFGYLLSSAGVEEFEEQNWTKLGVYSYLVLKDSTQAEAVEAKIQALNQRYIGDWADDVFRYHLQPITSIHLHSDLVGEFSPRTEMSQIYLFSAIGLLLLLVACINFVNLTMARYHRRLKEVGIRKVLGADRFRLVLQFLCESFLLEGLSMGAALLLVPILNPVFDMLIAGEMHLSGNILKVIAFVSVVGLISGLYPAIHLSSFQPVMLFRKVITRGSHRSVLRKMLIVVQFAVAIVLLVGTGVVYTQMQFIKNRPLGFNKDNILLVWMNNSELQEDYETIKSELLTVPGVVKATASGFAVLMNQDLKVYRPEGFGEDTIFVRTLYVDHDFLPTLEIDLAEGRNFAEDNPADAKFGYIVNKAAVKKFGWDFALGKQIEARGSTESEETAQGPVIGVLEDFHFRSFREEIGPLILRVRPERFDIITLKVETENLPGLISRLQDKWKQIDPMYPFRYEVMEAVFDGTYRRDRQFGRGFSYFSLISILIACLGLLGMIAFLTQQRTKEIGIRKVHGASVIRIVGLLNKEILILVALANLIAWPAGYFIMDNWLKNFAYRVPIDPLVFLGSAAAAFIIAAATLSVQSIRAASANPVDSLRYE